MVRIACYAMTWLLSFDQISKMLECEQSSYGLLAEDRQTCLFIIGPCLGHPCDYALGPFTKYAEFTSLFVVYEDSFILVSWGSFYTAQKQIPVNLKKRVKDSKPFAWIIRLSVCVRPCVRRSVRVHLLTSWVVLGISIEKKMIPHSCCLHWFIFSFWETWYFYTFSQKDFYWLKIQYLVLMTFF